jgi:hypothetical protein
LAKQFINYLYSKPVVDATEVAKILDVNISIAHRPIQDFEKLNILKEQTGYKRNGVFVFENYIQSFR